MCTVTAAISEFLKQIGDKKKIVVAYSGGVDSQALLVGLYNALGDSVNDRLLALHVNHGNTEYDDDWEDFCREFCTGNGIKLDVVHLEIGIGCPNFEAVSRDMRYKAFADMANQNTVVVTGHHMDDQAETMLLRLMRGSGVDGLSCIPYSRKLGDGMVYRPFLGVYKKNLKDYCTSVGVKWYHDVTNLDIRRDRNFIRQKVIPMLEQHWPNAVTLINRSVNNCKSASNRLNDLSRSMYDGCKIDNNLCIDTFNSMLSQDEQYDVLRLFFREHGLKYPAQGTLRVIIDEVINSDLNRTKAALQTSKFKCYRKKCKHGYQLVLEVY